MTTQSGECVHDVPYDEHCDWCDGDECSPPPSFGYRDRTDGDEMLPLLDPHDQGPMGLAQWAFLAVGVIAVVVVVVAWATSEAPR